MRACRRQDSTWHFPISRPAASREQSFCFSEISSTARPSALSKGHQARVAMVPTSANCRVKGHLCWSADSLSAMKCVLVFWRLFMSVSLYMYLLLGRPGDKCTFRVQGWLEARTGEEWWGGEEGGLGSCVPTLSQDRQHTLTVQL